LSFDDLRQMLTKCATFSALFSELAVSCRTPRNAECRHLMQSAVRRSLDAVRSSMGQIGSASLRGLAIRADHLSRGISLKAIFNAKGRMPLSRHCRRGRLFAKNWLRWTATVATD
jgi:hypothetical protein